MDVIPPTTSNSTEPLLLDPTSTQTTEQLDAIILCIITGLGLFGNLLIIASITLRSSMRKVANMFLLHHCFINFIQCLLFIPFILALLNESRRLKGCEIIGGMYVTMVTATVLNIAAMTACEAYRFEDLIQEQNINYSNEGRTLDNPDPQRIQDSNGTGSYTCVLFGLFMIWLSAIILHLGMTLIGSDAKQFYNYKIRNCFLVIGDQQTYVLYIMWILLTAVSLVLTSVYVKRIYRDISKRKYQDKSNFFITTPRFYEGKKGCGKEVEIGDRGRSPSRLYKKNKFSNSYESLTRQPSSSNNNNKTTNNSNPKQPNCFYLSHSTSHLSNPNPIDTPPFNHHHSKSLNNIKYPPHTYHTYSKSTTKHKLKRRFDFVKLILQRIQIQCLVIKLFIVCWMPLFLTVLIDTQFKVSTNVYRYLILIAFSNSSLTPYCYMTILIPKINKYCLPCMRTDGKQSKKKTIYYNAMERYYEKLGDRMHNLSGRSSLNSLNGVAHTKLGSVRNNCNGRGNGNGVVNNADNNHKGVAIEEDFRLIEEVNYLSGVHVSKFGTKKTVRSTVLNLNKFEISNGRHRRWD